MHTQVAERQERCECTSICRVGEPDAYHRHELSARHI
jgi:hypothetical protein